MIRSTYITLLLLAASLAQGGCAQRGETPQSGQSQSLPLVYVAHSTKKPAVQVARAVSDERRKNDPSASDPADPVTKAGPVAKARPVAKSGPLQPPYIARLDPFRRPDFNKTVVSREERLGTGEIELKGFANAGVMQALLAIDGKITAVQEGDQRADIQVIAIAPPQVILQRGRVRWTETLYGVP